MEPTIEEGIYLHGDTLCFQLPVPPSSRFGTVFVLHEVYLAFFDGKRIETRWAWKRWLNTLIGYFTNGFTHCELAFRFMSVDFTQECWLTCNIYQGERLQFEFKTSEYNKDKSKSLWSLFSLDLGKQQMNQLFCQCAEDVRRGIAFNSAIYTNFLLPSWLQYDGGLRSRAFCSEHVSAALKRVNCRGFEDVKPYNVDPNSLYNHVSTSALFKRKTFNLELMREFAKTGLLDL
jgi:hypothetical protein